MARFINPAGFVTDYLPDSQTEYYLNKGFKFAENQTPAEGASVAVEDEPEFSVEDPDADEFGDEE